MLNVEYLRIVKSYAKLAFYVLLLIYQLMHLVSELRCFI